MRAPRFVVVLVLFGCSPLSLVSPDDVVEAAEAEIVDDTCPETFRFRGRLYRLECDLGCDPETGVLSDSVRITPARGPEDAGWFVVGTGCGECWTDDTSSSDSAQAPSQGGAAEPPVR